MTTLGVPDIDDLKTNDTDPQAATTDADADHEILSIFLYQEKFHFLFKMVPCMISSYNYIFIFHYCQFNLQNQIKKKYSFIFISVYF